MNDKISIIIPVFNVAPYLNKCLDSVINQSYKSIEILVINDGSTDDSCAICDEYAKKDSRIKLFHKENGGLSSALNVGLKNFTGDYLGFVDSDDWIEPDMYEQLYNAIEQQRQMNRPPVLCPPNMQKTDEPSPCLLPLVAVCSYFKDTESGAEEMQNEKKITQSVISTEDMLHYPLKRDYYMGFCGYVWNKLYPAALIRESGLLFDEEIKYAMDVLFFETLVARHKCVGTYVNKPLYHYLQRDGAITKSESYDVKTDILKVYKRVEELLPEKDKYWARGFYCYHASVICELAIKKRDEDMLKKMQGEIKAHYGDYKRTNKDFPEKFKRMDALLKYKLAEGE